MYKYGRVAVLLMGMMWVGCDTTHKLTGTDYVDIESQPAPPVEQGYPNAIIEDAGWNDITTELKDRSEAEEFRIWVESPSLYPSHLFRLTKNKKKVELDALLFWKKDTSATADYSHIRMERYLRGTCIQLFEVDNYEYCRPEFKNEENIEWGSMYTTLENRDIWQIPDGTQSVAEGKSWKMYVQVRLGNYYRDFVHLNPHQYQDDQLKNKVMNLSSAVGQITQRFRESWDTNLFRGITDGSKFTLCDSSEVWQFWGNLDRLMEFEGLNSTVNTEQERSYYYVTIKGRVNYIWYNKWATGEFDRVLEPIQLYNIQAVNKLECPESVSGY